MQDTKTQRFARTQIRLDDGTYTDARITLSTGEVKPYAYKLATPPPKPLAKASVRFVTHGTGNLLDYTPHWVSINPLKAVDDGRAITLSRLSKENRNNVYLKDYSTAQDAIDDIPLLDNMLTGVSNLSYGNRKPLRTGMLFAMLRDIDTIDINAIKQYTGYSDNYCSRLAQYLRVLSNAFDSEVDR